MRFTKVRGGLLRFVFLLIIYLVVSAQTDAPPKPCSSPEAGHFDFWLGKWELTWNDTVTGTNIITKELDGCVVHENFSAPGTDFNGTSYSVYNATKNIWEQTWVDNQGSFMNFTGGFENGKMTLGRSLVGPKGNHVMQRMVFYDIAKDSLKWSWESSLDSGQTWNQNWLINYQRAPE